MIGTDAVGTAGVQPIGEVEDIAGSVVAVRADGTEVALAAGMPVFQGDVIETGPEGKVALVFADGTLFSLSPAARMVLDELVYDPAADSGSLLLSVIRGAFVFITGQIAGIAPDAMEVSTPAGVLGIRGTRAGCSIDADDGATACALLVGPDGHVGVVAFANAADLTVLTRPFEAVIAEGQSSALTTLQLDPAEVRSLLAGALGEGGLPEAEAGLLEKTGAATFQVPDAEGLEASGGAPSPLGPLPDVVGIDAPLPEGRRETRILLEQPAPEAASPEPTEIRPGQSITALPLGIAVLEQDFGDVVDFPLIPDGTSLFATPVFAEQGLGLFGDPESLTFENGAPSVSVTLVSESGQFQSALGAYVVAPDGRIGPPQLIFANASEQGGGGDLIPGESGVVLDNGGLGFAAGSTLSLFVLADGFRLNDILQQADAEGLALRFDEVGEGGLFPGVADVGDDGLQLLALAGDGAWVPLEGALFHTVAHFEGAPVGGQLVPVPGLNDDQPIAIDGQSINQHHIAGLGDEGTLLIGFEDLPFGNSDFDFGDLVVGIEVEPIVNPTFEPQPFAFDFTLDNEAGLLSALALEIENPAPGDSFLLGGPFALTSSGAVLQDGAATGIRLEQQDETTWLFTSRDPVGIATYEDVLNAVGLVTDLETPTAGTRVLQIEVVDPDGIASSLDVRFVVPDTPVIGTRGDDDLDGTAVNDALFGLAGDDLLNGRGGDDILIGGAGADRLRGGSGADFFRIDGLADVDADGDGLVDFVDQVLDFDPLEGDQLDLSGLLRDLGADDPDDFVNIESAAGGGIDVQVDLAGLAGAGGFQTIVQLLGTDMSEVEAAMNLSG